MRRRRVDLAERIDLLSRAVDLSEGRIPDDVVVQAREIGQVQADMPVLDAEIVKPAAVLDPEPCQEER